MQTNLRGLVERLELSPSRGMMPLYEAIANSLDAIGERGIGVSQGRIHIRLLPSGDLAAQAGETLHVVDGVEVTDNGIGFNDANLHAFEEAYTRSKMQIGGKGVGRFTYLKVFDRIQVKSTFATPSGALERNFPFSIDNELQGTATTTSTSAEPGTVATMKGVIAKYQRGWPTELDVIARRIITHFLIRFASKSFPPAVLEGIDGSRIDLHQMFDSTVQPYIEETSLTVSGSVFGLQVFRDRDNRTRHEITLCANGRGVLPTRLTDLLPELPERFLDESQEAYTLQAFVTGEYLDDHLNQERTHILFQSQDHDMGDTDDLISRSELNAAVSAALRKSLQEDLATTNTKKFAQIEKFVERAPEYRVLTSPRYRELVDQRITPGLSDEKLDEQLLHLRRHIEDNVRKDEKHVAARMESESYETYKEALKKLMEDMNEVGKSKLVDYVTHRRIILDLVGRSLKLVEADNKYPFERVLHKMVFPMGATSKDVFLEQQNLWIIDERLCYHTILTSDKKLNSVRGLENTSGKEPDIFGFFYDTPIGLSEPDGGAIVLVEFKRPMRDDYEKDPAAQIIDRFTEIKEGNVKDIEGRPVNPKNFRYFGYLIADLTPSLRRQVAFRYNQSADGQGYFYSLPGGEGYVEIVSYDKLLTDAKRRNRVLFDKLGLHKN